eukprot:scaffold143619_cov33-Cyclotella_meneghiniana.AAC.1
MPGNLDVRTVVLWNRQDCCTERLSGAKVSILGANSHFISEGSIGAITSESPIKIIKNFLHGPNRNMVSSFRYDANTNQIKMGGNCLGPSEIGVLVMTSCNNEEEQRFFYDGTTKQLKQNGSNPSCLEVDDQNNVALR